MDWILEKPLFVVLMGLLTAAVLGGLWLQTGRKQVLYALVAVLVGTGLLLLVERLVETDREQIDTILHRVARLVERNEIEAALRYAHSRADGIRQQARSELTGYEFQSIRIKQNLEIVVRKDAVPPTAVAEFNVTVVLSDRSGLLNNSRIPRFVTVNLEKEDGEWRAVDYKHQDPATGFRRRASKGK